MSTKTRFNTILAILAMIFITFGIITAVKADLSISSAYPPPMSVESLTTYPPPDSDVKPSSSSAYPPPDSETSEQTIPRKPSDAAQAALGWVKNYYKLSAEALKIIDDHPTVYPNLGRKFQVVTILDSSSKGKIYKLLVDLQNGQIYDDISALMSAENSAKISKYGNLQPSLYDKLQTLKDNEMVPVAIWLAPSTQNSLAEIQEMVFQTLASKYPEAQLSMNTSGKPFDVKDPAMAEKIEAEYLTLVNAAIEARATPLVTELTKQGYPVAVYKGLPTITAKLPKSVIISLSNRSDIGTIYLIDDVKPTLE